MKNKYKGIIMLFTTLIVVMSQNLSVFANNTEEIGDKTPDESIEIYAEDGPSLRPKIKEPSSYEGGYDLLTRVEGGNMEAINPLATKQHIARADTIENVGEDGQEFELYLEDEQVKQTRQFLTFTSKSGKTFHLVIDHEKTSQNVSLLTEVGEQDLLNMIEGEKSNVNTKAVEEEIIEEPQPEESEVVEELPEEKKKSPIIFILMILGVLGAGYYFKIYKPKNEDFGDEEYDDDEDEMEYENEFDQE